MKKLLNVLGILIAWLLSIALVLMLLVTPITFSVLSMLNADTVTKVVIDTLKTATDSAENQPSAEKAEMVMLSNSAQPASAEDEAKDILKDILGDKVNQEQIGAILSSDAVKELIEAYTTDLTNAITGGSQGKNFDADKIKEVVNDNIDQIVEVVQSAVPELAEKSAQELKKDIQKAVDENAEKVVDALPKPEELKEQLVESVPALETAMGILAMKDSVELAVIGVIVLLSVLIFVCRIPGLRGFRWLAVDLFVAGGMNALTTAGLLVSQSVVGEIVQQTDAQLVGLVGSLLSAFTDGMLVRTLVMFFAAAILLVIYLLIKKLRTKKLAAAQQGVWSAEGASVVEVMKR